MRKLMCAVVVMMNVGIACAWEHPGNPDRFPSLGLSLEAEGTTGTRKYPSAFNLQQDAELGHALFILDTRLPLSNSFTLDIALGRSAYTIDMKETAFLDSEKWELSGGYFKIGGRYYFNGGAR